MGIQLDGRGCIHLDGEFRTAMPNTYTIGDSIAGPMLPHKAEEESLVCVEGHFFRFATIHRRETRLQFRLEF